jgi:hypothetical protein
MDIGAWLCDLGLGQYEQAFRENDIDAEVLMDLTAEDLIGLGVVSIGHRLNVGYHPYSGRTYRHLWKRFACTRGRAPPTHRDVC